MSVKNELLGYQKEIKDLERHEQKLIGAIDTLYESLKKDIGDLSISDKEAIVDATEVVKDLRGQLKKAEKQLTEKVKLIENMIADMED